MTEGPSRLAPEGVHLIPLESLSAAPDNPRTQMLELEDLAASIRVHGVLQPAIVRPVNGELGKFQLIDGERRWRASRLAGRTHLPCLIRLANERLRQELMLVTNLQRRNLTVIEEAKAYHRLEKLGWTQGEIARQVGRSPGHISRRVLLLTLPKATQQAVAAKKIPIDRALGYDSGGPRDIFEADEQLSQAWRSLRQEILDSGDRVLIQRLREFAKAYQARVRLHGQPIPEEAAS